MEPNEISLPFVNGDFSTTALSLNFGATVSHKLFANGLVQWDDQSESLQANIRVDWR